EVLAAVTAESVVGTARTYGLVDSDDVEKTVNGDAVHFDRSRAFGETDAAARIGEPGAAVEADRVVGKQSVDSVVGHQPHFLEAVVEVGSQLSDAEIEEVLRTKRRNHVEPSVLDFRATAAVGVLGPGDLAEKAEGLPECARGKKIDFLRELKVVVNDLVA